MLTYSGLIERRSFSSAGTKVSGFRFVDITVGFEKYDLMINKLI